LSKRVAVTPHSLPGPSLDWVLPMALQVLSSLPCSWGTHLLLSGFEVGSVKGRQGVRKGGRSGADSLSGYLVE
jgi:hypothetical protein